MDVLVFFIFFDGCSIIKYLLTGGTFRKQYMWVVQVKTKRYAQHTENDFFTIS